ncbi:hypothetical protein PA598K_00882 [Paenibacillus sp. 598K]|uniref:spore germination protein GerPC n=1 Tax=Paenibacillus sp. 598K TaxID=1117987 RepID=UPI000FFA38A9|nr:spore germination protein GerPC [Paenibacillus sp. 598K]GBF72619.1 hypothetical protein PA598K_00882 [Paenibacillus sp. 598K]
MQQPFSWPDWAMQTQQQLQTQTQKVAELERQVCELRARLDTLGDKPAYTIEKLEYHFDQLKVERLDGTLHIGMMPPGAESQGQMDQFTVTPAYPKPPIVAQPGSTAPGSQPQPGAVDTTSAANDPLWQRLEHYMRHEAPQVLERIAEQRQLPLDHHHSRLILEDLGRQAMPRLAYYRETAHREGGAAPQADDAAITRTVNDIEEAMRMYLDRLLGEEPTS